MSSRTPAALIATLALLGAGPAAQQTPPAAQAAAKAPRSFPDAASHRAAFLKIIDRARVPPAPEVRALPDDEGLAVQHVSIAVEAGERATMLVVQSRAQGRRPAVVYLHGTGGSKERSVPRLKELAPRRAPPFNRRRPVQRRDCRGVPHRRRSSVSVRLGLGRHARVRLPAVAG
jgi:hypothetical protein